MHFMVQYPSGWNRQPVRRIFQWAIQEFVFKLRSMMLQLSKKNVFQKRLIESSSTNIWRLLAYWKKAHKLSATLSAIYCKKKLSVLMSNKNEICGFRQVLRYSFHDSQYACSILEYMIWISCSPKLNPYILYHRFVLQGK